MLFLVRLQIEKIFFVLFSNGADSDPIGPGLESIKKFPDQEQEPNQSFFHMKKQILGHYFTLTNILPLESLAADPISSSVFLHALYHCREPDNRNGLNGPDPA
jgi:hypothetical protein